MKKRRALVDSRLKKLETLRRLDRVEQNLLRLSDIVDEVETRLRAVRKQAGKAQRYREHTNRLQELRTQVGLTDWKHLTDTLADHQKQLDALTEGIGENVAYLEAIEARGLQLESELASSDDAIREGDRALASNREQIAGCESTIEHQRARLLDLEQEIAKRREHVTALTSKTKDLGSQLVATTEEVTHARQTHDEIAEQVDSLEKTLQQGVAACERLRGVVENRRAEQLRFVQKNSELGNEITSLETRLETETEAFSRYREQLGKLEAARRKQATELAGLVDTDAVLTEKLQQSEVGWKVAKARLKRLQSQLVGAQRSIAGLRESRSGLTERATVLEELERQFEGLSFRYQAGPPGSEKGNGWPFQ